MRGFRSFLIIATLLTFLSPAKAVEIPDVRFDGNAQFLAEHPGKDYLGAWFTDSSWRAIQTPSYLNKEDAPISDPLCQSVTECDGHQLSMVANLGFCHDAAENNCIENVIATESSGKNIPYTNQRYFPASQELVFRGKPESQVPNGSTPSVVQFPGLVNGSGETNYAIAAYVLRRFTLNADGSANYSDPLFLSSIIPVQLVSGDYVPRKMSKNSGGLNYSEWDKEVNCAVVEIGICGEPTSFPKDISFSLKLRLNQVFYGWLHGRLTGGQIKSTYLGGNNYSIEISGKPSAIPDVVAAVKSNDAPTKLLQDTFGFNSLANVSSSSLPLTAVFAPVRGTYTYNGFLNWLPYMTGKAAAMPSVWAVRNITKDQVLASSGDKALNCLIAASSDSKNNGIVGYVNTNATSYMSGPPTYNAVDQSLEYKVAAPHFTTDGSEFQGLYSLQIRADTARCIFNLSDAPVKATVSVTSSDGIEQTVATSVNLKDDFYYFQASGFHFSAPTIKLKLFNSAAAPSASPTPTASTSPSKDVSQVRPTAPRKIIVFNCVKGKMVKKVSGVNPKCPSGYKKA